MQAVMRNHALDIKHVTAFRADRLGNGRGALWHSATAYAKGKCPNKSCFAMTFPKLNPFQLPQVAAKQKALTRRHLKLPECPIPLANLLKGGVDRQGQRNAARMRRSDVQIGSDP